VSEIYPQINASNRLGVCREFIEILDWSGTNSGKLSLPGLAHTYTHTQSLILFFLFVLPRRKVSPSTLYSKISSRDEYRTVFQYFWPPNCDFFFYCPRDLYWRHDGAISSIVRHSFLLLSGFAKPEKFWRK